MSDGSRDASSPGPETHDALGVVEIVAPLPTSRVQRVAADASERLDLPVEKLVPLLDNRVGPVTKPLPLGSAQRVAEVLDAVGVEVELRSVPPTGTPDAPEAPAGPPPAPAPDPAPASTPDPAPEASASPASEAGGKPPASDVDGAAPSEPRWRPPLLPRDGAPDRDAAQGVEADPAGTDATEPVEPVEAAESGGDAAPPSTTPAETDAVEASEVRDVGEAGEAHEVMEDADGAEDVGPEAPLDAATDVPPASGAQAAPDGGTDDPWRNVLEPEDEDDGFGTFSAPRAATRTPPAAPVEPPASASPAPESPAPEAPVQTSSAVAASAAPSPVEPEEGAAAPGVGGTPGAQRAEADGGEDEAWGAGGGGARPADTSPWIRSGFDEDDPRWAAGTRDPFAEAERRERAVRRLVLGVALALAVGVFAVLQWLYA